MTSRRWVFTLNNPTDDEEQAVADFLDSDLVTYGVFGREVGESGTPHYQGFLILPQPQRLSYLRNNLSARAHYERAQGTSAQASAYCKKDNDFEEFGEIPDEQGARNDINGFVEWIGTLDTRPSERDIVQAGFASLFLRHRAHLLDLVSHLMPEPVIEAGEYGAGGRQWQRDLHDILEHAPDDRTINFVIDPDGGNGKSWFVRKMLSTEPGKVQVLSVGKRDDLAYAVDVSKTVFLFDVPRGGMEFFQYSVVEMLKNQYIFSGKYASASKVFPTKVHVVVFCNEYPDESKLTEDRFNNIIIS